MVEEVIAGVVIAIVLFGLNWLVRHMKFKRDESILFLFLKDSERSTKLDFRSSEAISSKTNLTINRVSEVCSKSKKIRRSVGGRETWCVS